MNEISEHQNQALLVKNSRMRRQFREIKVILKHWTGCVLQSPCKQSLCLKHSSKNGDIIYGVQSKLKTFGRTMSYPYAHQPTHQLKKKRWKENVEKKHSSPIPLAKCFLMVLLVESKTWNFLSKAEHTNGYSVTKVQRQSLSLNPNPAINAIVMDLRSKDPVSSTRQGWRSAGGRRPLATARPQIHMMGSFDWLTPSQRLRGGPAG